MGRKPLPSEIKRLRGNPGHRPINDKEPQPEPRLTTPPSWLNQTAKREYRRMGKYLLKAGLLTELDDTALAAYAVSYSRWREANEQIDATGAIMPESNGRRAKPSPWVGIASSALKEMVKLMGDFGMTPSSRSGLVVTPPGKPDFEDYFSLN
ncbi:MAG: phage terminase small subunit P27 family [Chloroflexi bacterium]|nr:phage terminase small subunit P27 family [Chloroflexota bacterium]